MSRRDDAIDWLRKLLRGGPRRATEVEIEAKAAGISLATVRRAKSQLSIETYREGGLGSAGYWVWRAKDQWRVADPKLSSA
jgi:putative DNA primase/helicase